MAVATIAFAVVDGVHVLYRVSFRAYVVFAYVEGGRVGGMGVCVWRPPVGAGAETEAERHSQAKEIH